jgi:tetratricopeptide (TPR) repeat protein
MYTARILIVAGFLGVGMHARSALASESNDWCDARWEEISSEYSYKSPPDYEGLLAVWKRLEGACAGQPRYWARLALTYFYLDRLKEAQSALASMRPADRQKESLVQLVQILVDAATLLDQRDRSEDELISLEQRLHAYSKENPSDAAGLSLMADVLSQLGRHQVAVESYETALKAIGVSRRSVGLLRNLTIGYVDVGRYEDAYNVAGTALSLDKGLFTDLYFICAAAKAQAAIGKIKGAQDALTVIAAKRPEVKQDPHFKATVAYVVSVAKASDNEQR